MAPDVPQDGAKPTPGIRVAAEYRWTHPDATWAEVAASAGVHRNTLERWRDTEAWEVASRTAGAEHVDSLGPAAIAALRKNWERGNASGAVEVLRALGFLKPSTVEQLDTSRDRDLNAEITALIDKLLERRRDHEELIRRHEELRARHPEDAAEDAT